jgi:hypothetical protein
MKEVSIQIVHNKFVNTLGINTTNTINVDWDEIGWNRVHNQQIGCWKQQHITNGNFSKSWILY